MLGPPTQDALRPSGTLRENHMLQTERRKKKKAAGSTAGSVRSDGTPKRTKSGRRIPTVRARLARRSVSHKLGVSLCSFWPTH
jgi:hypothetical protein